VTAIPIPRIPNAKNPGTNFNTVAPHEEELYKAPCDAAAVLTSVETGPTKLVPIRIATKPPIRFAIISDVILLNEFLRILFYLNLLGEY
jgi:hypothetical protein